MKLPELNGGKELTGDSKVTPEIFNTIVDALKEIHELYVGGDSNG